MKKGIKWILWLFWCLVIFLFSAQNGDTSGALSDGILEKFYHNFAMDGLIDLKWFLVTYSFWLRKLAHFMEYFILGVLTFWCFKDVFLKRSILYAIVFVFLYAAGDEVHQLFVDGRSFQYMDMLIDGCGGICGVILFQYLEKRYQCRKSLSSF